jgi:site-specific DNA-methyltransferase (adenine-specific)
MARPPNPCPSPLELHRLFDYDPDRGFLVWKPRDDQRWNSNFAGNPAGADSQGYVRIEISGIKYLAHRLIWKWHTGEDAPLLRHQDGNGFNNRMGNLIASDIAINQVMTDETELPLASPHIAGSDPYTLIHSDMIEALAAMPEASVDGVCCDPPYHLQDATERYKPGVKTRQRYFRDKGFTGAVWDGGHVAFDVATWATVLRVMKPGAHLLAFGSPRTNHRMVTAIEAAGFEIRDSLGWVYGQGFPAGSVDVAKAIDAETLYHGSSPKQLKQTNQSRPGDGRIINPHGMLRDQRDHPIIVRDTPATEAGAAWNGYQTRLKPAIEPIVLARKPLGASSVARNVMMYGTGGLNVDGCRIPHTDRVWGGHPSRSIYGDKHPSRANHAGASSHDRTEALGRWPSNLLLDDPDLLAGHSHLFWCAKAAPGEKHGSGHPCVKPLGLMRYLTRLIGFPGASILDPFAGTGTTGQAALLEGMRPVMIERETAYVADIERRLARFEPALMAAE